MSYSDDYSKRMLGSDQHCCRKPTYYEPCKREKNVFLLQPAARVSFRSCYGSVLLDSRQGLLALRALSLATCR